MPPRVLLHADMDAFFASVEQRDRPELRGRPVIVGGAGPRGVVSTASYEARVYGVRSAMPGGEARRRCPDGVFVAPRMAAYVEASRAVREVFERFTPLIEPLSLDEAFLDVTGSTRLFGDGLAIARALKQGVFEATALRVSVGVAPCKFAAKVASDLDKPDGLVVVPEDVAAFLAPLPVARLWGAGPKTQARLHALGLRTIGDVQRVAPAALASALGARSADHFLRLAVGDDPRPVVVGRELKSVSHETTFAEDVVDRQQLHEVLFELSEMVGRRLRRRELRGTTVRLKLRYPDFTTLTRQRQVARTDDDRVVSDVVRALFDAVWDGRGVRLLGVGVAGLGDEPAAEGPQQGLLFGAAHAAAGAAGDEAGEEAGEEPDAAEEAATRRSLLAAMDQIRERFGEGAIRHGGAGRRVADDRDRISDADFDAAD